MSAKRQAELAAAGVVAMSTFLPRTRESKTSRPRRDTGPSRTVRGLVVVRAGAMCEWAGCPRPFDDVHHRLAKKSGGRHGEMAERLNMPAWLLAACRLHHDYVTSPTGDARKDAIRRGWLLVEGQDATQIPVVGSHDLRPILLDNCGGWQVAPCPT